MSIRKLNNYRDISKFDNLVLPILNPIGEANNSDTLGKIDEVNGEPTWDGGPWPSASSSAFPEAPLDGKQYVRQDGDWSEAIAAIPYQDEEPPNPVHGQLWIDKDDNSGSAPTSISSTPINLTSASSDYALAVGETAYITYTSATSVPLRVSTAEGLYEIKIIGDRSISISNVTDAYLTPNNITYASSFKRLQTVTNSSSSAAGVNYVTDNYIALGSGRINYTAADISTYTNSKSLEYTSHYDVSISYRHQASIKWDDTTTAWTSLGTINFSFAQSGKIVIKRII